MDGIYSAPHINALGGGYGGYSGYGFGGAGFLEAILLLAIVGNGNGGFLGGGGLSSAVNMNTITDEFLFTNISNQLDELSEKLSCVDKDIIETKYDLGTQISNASYANAMGQKELQTAITASVGALSGQIERAHYDALQNTNVIVQSGNNNTQRIIDFLTSQDIKAQDQKINYLEMKNFANEIITANQPQRPIPSYVVPSPYESMYGFGFAGGRNCNGCN